MDRLSGPKKTRQRALPLRMFSFFRSVPPSFLQFRYMSVPRSHSTTRLHFPEDDSCALREGSIGAGVNWAASHRLRDPFWDTLELTVDLTLPMHGDMLFNTL